jgi:predicted nucleic acid-binding protein
MKRTVYTVYLETSFISYLTGRTSGDLLVAAHQKASHDWWAQRSSAFKLNISDFVWLEAQDGHPEAAQRRVDVIVNIASLETIPAVDLLAQALLDSGAVPAKAKFDALHIAIAAVHGMDYLLTWNFKHIANAEKWASIEAACLQQGFKMPRICSPLELMDTE